MAFYIEAYDGPKECGAVIQRKVWGKKQRLLCRKCVHLANKFRSRRNYVKSKGKGKPPTKERRYSAKATNKASRNNACIYYPISTIGKTIAEVEPSKIEAFVRFAKTNPIRKAPISGDIQAPGDDDYAHIDRPIHTEIFPFMEDILLKTCPIFLRVANTHIITRRHE